VPRAAHKPLGLFTSAAPVVTTLAGTPGGSVPGMLSLWGVVLVGTTLHVTTNNAIAQVTAVR
jgi:hypothetical protein